MVLQNNQFRLFWESVKLTKVGDTELKISCVVLTESHDIKNIYDQN